MPDTYPASLVPPPAWCLRRSGPYRRRNFVFAGCASPRFTSVLLSIWKSLPNRCRLQISHSVVRAVRKAWHCTTHNRCAKPRPSLHCRQRSSQEAASFLRLSRREPGKVGTPNDAFFTHVLAKATQPAPQGVYERNLLLSCLASRRRRRQPTDQNVGLASHTPRHRPQPGLIARCLGSESIAVQPHHRRTRPVVKRVLQSVRTPSQRPAPNSSSGSNNQRPRNESSPTGR